MPGRPVLAEAADISEFLFTAGAPKRLSQIEQFLWKSDEKRRRVCKRDRAKRALEIDGSSELLR